MLVEDLLNETRSMAASLVLQLYPIRTHTSINADERNPGIQLLYRILRRSGGQVLYPSVDKPGPGLALYQVR